MGHRQLSGCARACSIWSGMVEPAAGGAAGVGFAATGHGLASWSEEPLLAAPGPAACSIVLAFQPAPPMARRSERCGFEA